MEKITAIWALFRQGEAVADPAAWHKGQITATLLGGVILAAVHALALFGHPLPIDADSANSLGAGIIVVVNLVFTVTGSPHVGLPAKPPVSSADGATSAGVQSIDQATVQRAEEWQRSQRGQQ